MYSSFLVTKTQIFFGYPMQNISQSWQERPFLKNETFVARGQGGLHNSGARKVKCQLNFKITRIDALIKQIICKQNKSNLRKTSSNNFKPYLTCEKQPNA